ncbi:hypothetical protein KXJ72_17525 (plasmid) [Comamonas aquatica]|nr:hypothetical protein KXJ72_17525 [Comamonas aquatica]
MFVFHRNYGIERSLVIDKQSTLQLIRDSLLTRFDNTWSKPQIHNPTMQVLREVLKGSGAGAPVFTVIENGFESTASALQRNSSVTVLPAWLLDCIATTADYTSTHRLHEHRHYVLSTMRRNLGLHHMPKLVDIRLLQGPYEQSLSCMDVSTLTRPEQRTLAALEGINQLISAPMRRQLRIAHGNTLTSWTDGFSYITFNRAILAACTSTQGAFDAVMKLVNEYAHVQETWFTREQDEKFYQRFHTIVSTHNMLCKASEISLVAAISEDASKAVNDEARWLPVKSTRAKAPVGV